MSWETTSRIHLFKLENVPIPSEIPGKEEPADIAQNSSATTGSDVILQTVYAVGEGTDCLWKIAKEEIKRINENAVALDTIFGWCIQGRFSLSELNSEESICSNLLVEEKLSRTLESFWNIESLGVNSPDERLQNEKALRKRLRNIADNADKQAHNLYLNHTQATPNAEYVDYEDEETDCSPDISELNHPKRDLNAWTPFNCCGRRQVWRLGPGCGCNRFKCSPRCLITSNNSHLVVDENKLRREKAKVRKDLKFQALSEAQVLPLKGLYFDGRKDSTLIEERVDTKRYTRKAKE
ncbi:hypothetical protein AVEN_34702-1 [Araneus ventricosus]|uniref:Uncharacterized protein n=1 Tax=Araneus ventricosus TaxID=182803 RepID=A0A4Y2B261_ARAVE|nr:hypothetical protein AVEN_34702-1 [Araneus ventricosus]